MATPGDDADATRRRGRERATAAAPVVGVVAALAFTGAGAATWVARPLTRTVGDVAVTETRTTAGIELTPWALVAGLVAVVAAIAMLAARGALRRSAAVLLTVAGASTVVTAVTGLTRLSGADGDVTAAPWVAVAAAVLVVAAGLAGLGRARTRMPARYDVGGATDDDEWELAEDTADQQEPPGRAGAGDPEPAEDPTDADGAHRPAS